MSARIAEPGAAADERRRIDLLRRIADTGGKITPHANPRAERGYEYLAPCDGCEGDLRFLSRRDYLEQRFFDRVSLCPKCGSHHLNVREVCPGCRRAHLASEGLLHHFRCGYVGVQSEFTTGQDGSRVCPKCNRELRHLGTEYDRLGKASICRQCGLITENPPVEALCLACGTRTPAENLLNAEVFSYALTSLGLAAIRRGSLLDADDEFLFVDGAPVYRRTVILELFDHEIARFRHFGSEFSVLLAEYTGGATHEGESSLVSWATRLRQCLREVDLIGQLTDALLIVLLPHTTQRAAEALRQRIRTELGPQLPFTLSVAEITESGQLAQILFHASAEREPE
jgi:Thaumarchaeal output domain 1/Diguanylate cyclase, GGDEF domain